MTLKKVMDTVQHIPSTCFPPEQKMWFKNFHNLPKGSVIVDFGTGWAKSAISLALICPYAYVYTFDNGNEPFHTRLVWNEMDYADKVNGEIKICKAENITFAVADVNRLIFEKPIDLLNFDTDVNSPSFRSQLATWSKRVKIGGYISYHSFWHHRYPQTMVVAGDVLGIDWELVSIADCSLVKVGLFRRLR